MVVFRRVYPRPRRLAAGRLELAATQTTDTPVSDDPSTSLVSVYTGHLTIPLSSPVSADYIWKNTTVDIKHDIGILPTDISPVPDKELPTRDTPIHPAPTSSPNPSGNEIGVSPLSEPAADESFSGIRIDLKVEPPNHQLDNSRSPLTVRLGDKTLTRAQVPSAYSLTCLEHLVEGTETRPLIDGLTQFYGQASVKRSFFECLGDARYVFEFPAYLSVMDRLCDYNGSYRRELATNAPRFFKNMLLYDKYYYITSRDELEHRLDRHNQHEHLTTVNQTEVENLYLRQYIEESNSATSPNDFGIVLTSKNTLMPTPQLAKLVIEADGNISHIQEYLKLAAPDPDLSYDEFVAVKEAAENTTIAERGVHWEQAVVPAAFQGTSEFVNVLANYLYWDAVSSDTYGLQAKPEIYKAAMKLFSSLDDPVMDQKSNYQQKAAEGHLERIEENHNEALLRFSEARDIASNKHGNWETELPVPYGRSYRSFVISHKRLLVEDERWKEAISVLEDGIEETSNIESLPSALQETLIHHLIGNLEESAAEIKIQDDDIESARERLERAMHHFDEAQKLTRKEMVLARLESLVERPDETTEQQEKPPASETTTTLNANQSSDDFSTKSESTTAPGQRANKGQSAATQTETPTDSEPTQPSTKTAQTSEMPSVAEREEVTVTRKQRDSQFRDKVYSVYDHRCAICGARRASSDGSYEIEAAHIMAVGHGGPDIVQNGIALCQLHHWAFDTSWLAVSDNYTVIVADQPEVAGYDDFAPLEGTELILPEKTRYHPHKEYLEHHRGEHSLTVVSDEESISEDEFEEARDSTKTQSRDSSSGSSNSSKRMFMESIQGSRNDLINGPM